MFAQAYQIASGYTYPVVSTQKHLSGEVSSSLGSFVVLNPEGWIFSVAHILSDFQAFMNHKAELEAYERRKDEIEASTRLSAKQKRNRANRLNRDAEWITHQSYWWGRDDWHVVDITANTEADIFIGRIEDFDPGSVSNYPVIKNPENLPCGTSLCKLGFPFHNVAASFNEGTGQFELAPGTLPIPRFPIDGILTRQIRTDRTFGRGNYPVSFLETSSPGLRGQSGGPIFDTKGTLWAIQSRTHHLSLGFSPKVDRNGREVEENQFLNVGVGIHPEVIINALTDLGISFEMSDY
jgi:hypothetical protein